MFTSPFLYIVHSENLVIMQIGKRSDGFVLLGEEEHGSDSCFWKTAMRIDVREPM